MIVLVWNCRGIGNPRFLKNARELCRMHRPTFFCLVETRSNDPKWDDLDVKLGFDNSFRVPSEGFAGGIWLMWKSGNYTVEIMGSNEQVIHAKIFESGKDPWLLSTVYIRPYRHYKDRFWDHAKDFSLRHQLAWIMIGDSNDYFSANEKVGGSVCRSRCRKFEQNVSDCNLSDMDYFGHVFTWIGRTTDNETMKIRLDRALLNVLWRLLFPDARLLTLPRAHGDHHPLLLKLQNTRPRKKTL